MKVTGYSRPAAPYDAIAWTVIQFPRHVDIGLSPMQTTATAEFSLSVDLLRKVSVQKE